MGSVRALARREPTFALHVHVGLPDPEVAIRVANRMRVHLPLLLALSANSPFWQGRDTGLASARTPLFQAFPRVGIPRAFADFGEWADIVDLLIRTDTMPDATYIWWDVRPQPRFGTIEVRIMDAQSGLDRVGPLVALVQSLARVEATEGLAPDLAIHAQEVLDENRFLATRDGVHARFVDPVTAQRIDVAELLDTVIGVCAPHAQDLGCADELARVDRHRGRRRRRAPAAAGRGARRARRARRGAGGRVPRRAGGRPRLAADSVRYVTSTPERTTSSANHSLTLERGLRVLRVLSRAPRRPVGLRARGRDGDAPRGHLPPARPAARAAVRRARRGRAPHAGRRPHRARQQGALAAAAGRAAGAPAPRRPDGGDDGADDPRHRRGARRCSSSSPARPTCTSPTARDCAIRSTSRPPGSRSSRAARRCPASARR